MKTVCIKGIVFSGKGEGAKFIGFPWVKKQVTEKLGFTPHLGTLNLKLTKDDPELGALLRNAEAIEISPAKGYSHGKCFKAKITDNLECAIVVPETQDYPKDMIEVIAPTNLREKLQLRDGDTVEIRILVE